MEKESHQAMSHYIEKNDSKLWQELTVDIEDIYLTFGTIIDTYVIFYMCKFQKNPFNNHGDRGRQRIGIQE